MSAPGGGSEQGSGYPGAMAPDEALAGRESGVVGGAAGAAEPARGETGVPPRLHTRVRRGIRHRHNWYQLGRFVTVGASGYVANLVVYSLMVHVAGVDYRISAGVAFAVALANNFWWNRHWTFAAHEGPMHFQAARFLVVSLLAFGFNLVVLVALVSGLGMAKVPAQAIAIVCATPLNFVGNKLWSFRR